MKMMRDFKNKGIKDKIRNQKWRAKLNLNYQKRQKIKN
jgi:hypothetical protein